MSITDRWEDNVHYYDYSQGTIEPYYDVVEPHRMAIDAEVIAKA